jgi:hypothetical protein
MLTLQSGDGNASRLPAIHWHRGLHHRSHLPNGGPSSIIRNLDFMNSLPKNRRSGTDFVAVAGMVVIGSALLLGGATRVDVLAPLVPRLVAAFVIAALIWRGQFGWSGWTWPEKLLWIMLLAVPAIQLIPLPPAIWTALPGRDYASEIISATGPVGWMPISLTPDATLNSILALVPAIAAYSLARQANELTIRLWFGFILLIGTVGAGIGLLQLASGEDSSLYFYVITNADAAVGFFSNANHHGSFLACCLLLLAYWMLEKAATARNGEAPQIIAVTAIAALIISLAIPLTLSRAGLIFMIGVYALVLAFMINQLRLPPRRAIQVWVAAAIIAAVGLYIFLVPYGALDAMRVDIRNNGRIDLVPLFVAIAGDFLPLGSGMGSFDPVFRGYEEPSALSFNYLNHAHNDYAQLAIEGGLPAIIGMLFALGWWATANITILHNRSLLPERRLLQALVAMVATGILLAHSLADYPLRGAGVSVCFAIFVAVIARAADGARVSKAKNSV